MSFNCSGFNLCKSDGFISCQVELKKLRNKTVLCLTVLAMLLIMRAVVPYTSRSSRGLGHRPFTAVTGVRLPYGTPYSDADGQYLRE